MFWVQQFIIYEEPRDSIILNRKKTYYVPSNGVMVAENQWQSNYSGTKVQKKKVKKSFQQM